MGLRFGPKNCSKTQDRHRKMGLKGDIEALTDARQVLTKPIWIAIETTLFYYSGNMYSWSNLVQKW
jgi:hypothetical protein